MANKLFTSAGGKDKNEGLRETSIGIMQVQSGKLVQTDDPHLRHENSFVYDNIPTGQYQIIAVHEDVAKWAPHLLIITNSNSYSYEAWMKVVDSHSITTVDETLPGELGILIERSYGILIDGADPPLKPDNKVMLNTLFGVGERVTTIVDEGGTVRGVAFVPVFGAGWYPVVVERVERQFTLIVNFTPYDPDEDN